jgi:hypothetical protein
MLRAPGPRGKRGGPHRRLSVRGECFMSRGRVSSAVMQPCVVSIGGYCRRCITALSFATTVLYVL